MLHSSKSPNHSTYLALHGKDLLTTYRCTGIPTTLYGHGSDFQLSVTTSHRDMRELLDQDNRRFLPKNVLENIIRETKFSPGKEIENWTQS